MKDYENKREFGGIGSKGDGMEINYKVMNDMRMLGIKEYK